MDFLITGVGTGGHITGVSEALKERFPSLQTFAVEPAKSPVISGGEPSPHRLQGIGAGFVPANLHTDTLDGVIQVSEEDALRLRGARPRARRASSSARRRAPRSPRSRRSCPTSRTAARVLTFCYDTGERYFSVEGLFSADGGTVSAAGRSTTPPAGAST